jgi:hypothetical protein
MPHWAVGVLKVLPPKLLAFRLVTCVVEATCNGAVPVATVETSAGAEMLLLEMTAFVEVPAIAGAVNVAVPLVEPFNPMLPDEPLVPAVSEPVFVTFPL